MIVKYQVMIDLAEPHAMYGKYRPLSEKLDSVEEAVAIGISKDDKDHRVFVERQEYASKENLERDFTLYAQPIAHFYIGWERGLAMEKEAQMTKKAGELYTQYSGFRTYYFQADKWLDEMEQIYGKEKTDTLLATAIFSKMDSYKLSDVSKEWLFSCVEKHNILESDLEKRGRSNCVFSSITTDELNLLIDEVVKREKDKSLVLHGKAHSRQEELER